VDPFAGPARWLVAGPPRSGRSTVLRLLATQAHAAGIATLIAATERSDLLTTARERGIPTIGPASAIGPPPSQPTLVLVDDSDAFTDTAAGAQLADWARDRELALALVAAGRADDLATSYRGVAAEVRRYRVGVLLRPGPLDGELFGLRLPRRGNPGPPGRGVALADPSWGTQFATGGPVPIQVATP
jgi:S-DNA-T family DNA segregation ATPase FtsK/SpoIIIE